MIRYTRWRGVALGATTFVAGHLIEVAKWRTWFDGGEHAPWFLNDGSRAVLFMAGCLFVVTLAAGIAWTRVKADALVHAANVSGGAIVAMIVLIFLAPWGPSNLFPIAIAIGAGAVFASTFAAAAIVAAVKRSSP